MVKTADVVPGANALATWGNEVRDRSIQIFATTIERDSAYPIPARGQCCYITSGDANEGFWTYDGIAWRPPWNTAWGELFRSITSINVGSVVAETDLFTFSFTPVANRKYRFDFQCQAGSSVPGDIVIVSLTDSTNSWQFIATDIAGNGASFPNTVIGQGFNAASLGNSTLNWKMRGKRSIGTGNCVFYGANPQLPSYVVIVDIGPLPGVPS